MADADTIRRLWRYKSDLEEGPDEEKLLEILGKLKRLHVSIAALQETGVGKLVNAYRKYEGIVGQRALEVVNFWKTQVEKEVDQKSTQKVTKSEHIKTEDQDSDADSWNSFHEETSDSEEAGRNHKDPSHREKYSDKKKPPDEVYIPTPKKPQGSHYESKKRQSEASSNYTPSEKEKITSHGTLKHDYIPTKKINGQVTPKSASLAHSHGDEDLTDSDIDMTNANTELDELKSSSVEDYYKHMLSQHREKICDIVKVKEEKKESHRDRPSNKSISQKDRQSADSESHSKKRSDRAHSVDERGDRQKDIKKVDRKRKNHTISESDNDCSEKNPKHHVSSSQSHKTSHHKSSGHDSSSNHKSSSDYRSSSDHKSSSHHKSSSRSLSNHKSDSGGDQQSSEHKSSSHHSTSSHKSSHHSSSRHKSDHKPSQHTSSSDHKSSSHHSSSSHKLSSQTTAPKRESSVDCKSSSNISSSSHKSSSHISSRSSSSETEYVPSKKTKIDDGIGELYSPTVIRPQRCDETKPAYSPTPIKNNVKIKSSSYSKYQDATEQQYFPTSSPAIHNEIKGKKEKHSSSSVIREQQYSPTPLSNNIRVKEERYSPTPVPSKIKVKEERYSPTPVNNKVLVNEERYSPTPVTYKVKVKEEQYSPTPILKETRVKEERYSPIPMGGISFAIAYSPTPVNAIHQHEDSDANSEDQSKGHSSSHSKSSKNYFKGDNSSSSSKHKNRTHHSDHSSTSSKLTHSHHTKDSEHTSSLKQSHSSSHEHKYSIHSSSSKDKSKVSHSSISDDKCDSKESNSDKKETSSDSKQNKQSTVSTSSRSDRVVDKQRSHSSKHKIEKPKKPYSTDDVDLFSDVIKLETKACDKKVNQLNSGGSTTHKSEKSGSSTKSFPENKPSPSTSRLESSKREPVIQSDSDNDTGDIVPDSPKSDELSNSLNKGKKSDKPYIDESAMSFDDFLNFDEAAIMKKSKPSSKSSKAVASTSKASSSTSKTSSSVSLSSKAKSSQSPLIETSKLQQTSSSKFSIPTPTKSLVVTEKDLLSLLPETHAQYKPLRYNPYYMDGDERARSPTPPRFDPETVGVKSLARTQVYSGRKHGITEVKPLYDLCMQVLIENIDLIEDVGGVPYAILKPVLERCTAQQLCELENFNPHFLEDTDELWENLCSRDFRGCKREEMESWRELYMRKFEERELKYQKLKNNMSSTITKGQAGRKAQLAYVDTVAKPPREVLRKQKQFGTGCISRKGNTALKPYRPSFTVPAVNPMTEPQRMYRPTPPMLAKALQMRKNMRR
ncbi:serine/arginine repetitive matrix protein 5 [Biomphalaria pfeifferi]|uniref:Serine/arginine repetitive matrix protein 5 n=1 Tax=Biomphalaria pfeifferi TaxID=112525 RepID=A0AAD8EZG1_BIOPF|nr:serine/arginine repetitive matrix protein 5 [Biomphalaria pfeifferi]